MFEGMFAPQRSQRQLLECLPFTAFNIQPQQKMCGQFIDELHGLHMPSMMPSFQNQSFGIFHCQWICADGCAEATGIGMHISGKTDHASRQMIEVVKSSVLATQL